VMASHLFDRIEAYRGHLTAEAEKSGHTDVRTRVESPHKIVLTATLPCMEELGYLPAATDFGLKVRVGKQTLITRFDIEGED